MGFIDFVDLDMLSKVELSSMLKELGYAEEVLLWHKLPGKSLHNGLKITRDDKDVVGLHKYTPDDKDIEIYYVAKQLGSIYVRVEPGMDSRKISKDEGSSRM